MCGIEYRPVEAAMDQHLNGDGVEQQSQSFPSVFSSSSSPPAAFVAVVVRQLVCGGIAVIIMIIIAAAHRTDVAHQYIPVHQHRAPVVRASVCHGDVAMLARPSHQDLRAEDGVVGVMQSLDAGGQQQATI